MPRKEHTSPWYHYLSRDEMVEAHADKTIVYFAEKMNAPVYIVHLANAEGYEEVKRAKGKKGIPVFGRNVSSVFGIYLRCL